MNFSLCVQGREVTTNSEKCPVALLNNVSRFNCRVSGNMPIDGSCLFHALADKLIQHQMVDTDIFSLDNCYVTT